MSRLALLGFILVSGGAPQDPKTVHLFIWAEYISKDVLAEFEKETGIKVVESNFENEESMLAKLQQPGTHFDVVVASNEVIPAMVRQKLLGEFEPAKVPNLKHLEARFVKPPYDPGGTRAVPYMWGTLGIAYNSEKVKMDDPSWAVLWDPKHKGKICMFDQPTATVGVALRYTGRPLSSRDDGDLAAAKEALLAQKDLVHAYSNDEYKSYLQADTVWLSMAWNGDAAKVSKDKPAIQYAIPKEGSSIWVDNLCVLARPCNAEAVHKFLDYVMRPEVNAKIAEEIFYATCNAEARKRVSKEMQENRAIYPDEETLKRCAFREDLGPDIEKYRKVWDGVKGE